MLNAKENMRECIRKGGKPERFVNQYEAVQLLFDPHTIHDALLKPGDLLVKNAWGVYNSFPVGTPGQFPVQDDAHLLIKDIEHWKDYVTAPSLDFPQEEWDMMKAMYDGVDGSKSYKATFVAPGLFEQCHHFLRIEEALVNLYEYPDEMHDLIKYLTEWELKLAELICKNLKPDAIFHHDDWGSANSTFMSVDMFEDFYKDAYKEIYGYYHDHGVELIIHHSDSYAATLVPDMIEIGIDVWQGATWANDIPSIIKKYGGDITIMGGIDNKFMDFEGWTDEDTRKASTMVMEACGMNYFIPCIAQGGPGSVFPGAYLSMCNNIDKYNEEKLGMPMFDGFRLPFQIMF